MVWTVQSGILLFLFIGFDLNTLPNSLQLPLLHEVVLFLQSIDYIHLYSPSNVWGIMLLYPISYAF